MKTRIFLISLTTGLGLALALTLVWTASAQTARAGASAPVAELHVCTACAYTTIQAAVDAASAGDAVKVAGGTYTASGGEVVSVTKNLTLTGGYLPPNWDTSDPDANLTILDGQDTRRGIYIAADSSVTLDGLQIIRGSGGGVYKEPYAANSRLTIRNTDIMSNTTGNNGGGGVYVRGGALVLQNSRVISNTAGGYGNGGGIFTREAEVTIINNTIQDNNSASGGGGAWIYECTAYLAGNTFAGNRSGWNGGGLQSTWGNVTLTGNTFSNNEADGHGGGIAISGVGAGNVYSITHNLIQSNVACRDCPGVGGGASMSNGSGWIEFSHNQVISNTASQGSKGSGGGIYISGPARMEDNLIQGNRACTGGSCIAWGGGVALDNNIWMDRNRILDNWANLHYDYWDSQGGGVAIGVQDQVTMTNNIIAGNHYADVDLSRDNGGGAIYIGGQTSPGETWLVFYHNTVADNQSPAILNESAGITMSHTIYYSQTTDIKTIVDTSGLGPVPVTTLDYTLWWPAMGLDARDGSIIAVSNDSTADPLFTTLGLDDYHLSIGSPAIDLGPGVGVTSDIDGYLRPIGNSYDLGADEALFVYLPLAMRSP